jgi:hypothetical protein
MMKFGMLLVLGFSACLMHLSAVSADGREIVVKNNGAGTLNCFSEGANNANFEVGQSSSYNISVDGTVKVRCRHSGISDRTWCRQAWWVCPQEYCSSYKYAEATCNTTNKCTINMRGLGDRNCDAPTLESITQ